MNACKLALAIFATSLPVGLTQAQTYPIKPIRYVVGYPPGGGTDILTRLVGQKLTEIFGQQLVVDNRPGGNSNVAAEMVSKGAPDGYLIFMMSQGLTINKAIDSSLTFDLTRDFAPIALIGSVPHIVAVHPSLPVKSVAELIALARSKPGQLTYASTGHGGSEHVAAEMFASGAKIKLLHVPYKGGGPAAIGLVTGEVALGFNVVPPALPFIKNGRMKALAVLSERRAVALPDVPTIAEAGLPGYAISAWYGTVAPAGTPSAVVSRLNAEINKILKMADVRERLATLGIEPLGSTPEAFGAYIKSEVARYAKVAKDANIRVEYPGR